MELDQLFIPKEGQKIVADIRGCINASPNTVAAASYAVEMGANRILLSALYHDKDEGERPTIFLISPFINEYLYLAEMSYEKWFTGPHRISQTPVPDGLPDLSLVDGLQEIWLEFLNEPAECLLGWELAQQSLPSHLQLRFFSRKKIEGNIQNAIGADPEGKLGFKFLWRPNNLLNDVALEKRQVPIIKKTFSLDGHPSAEYVTVPLP
jgi:hypothetical protein